MLPKHTLLLIVCWQLISADESCWNIIESHYPRQYVAYYSATPPTLDGKLDEPFWNSVPFSSDFVDISTPTAPEFATRIKIRFDDNWLYIGASVQDPAVWANITYTCHCYNTSEDQVIFHGNDFEVFVDADGTCHNYKEFEINAANASWDLLLDKPYEDGGYENSSRVFGSRGFDMVPPLRSAVNIWTGQLNDPNSGTTGWSVEVAFPLSRLVYNTTASFPPKDKTFWRINFSRVEWAIKIVENSYWMEPSCQSCPTPGTATCDNWVWSPMYAIDLHHPEMWGFLQFSLAQPNTTNPIINPEWPERYAAHVLYYAEHAFFSKQGRFTSNVTELLPLATQPSVLEGTCTYLPTILLKDNATRFEASIRSRNISQLVVSISDDRYITARY